MSRLSEVIEYIHKNPIGHEQEWEKLRDRIMSNNDSKEYWFTLLKDVEDDETYWDK